jgi:uncharacterized protein YcfL
VKNVEARKILMAFVALAMLIACISASPCHAKPVQLLDYNAQTFFDNYKLAAKNISPKLLPFIDDSLTYEGETSLYRKYKFRVAPKFCIYVYENKGGGVSVIEASSDTIPEKLNVEITQMYCIVSVCIAETLNLKGNECTELHDKGEKKESGSDKSYKVCYKSSTYSSLNQRYIHQALDFSWFTVKNTKFFATTNTYSADDEE